MHASIIASAFWWFLIFLFFCYWILCFLFVYIICCTYGVFLRLTLRTVPWICFVFLFVFLHLIYACMCPPFWVYCQWLCGCFDHSCNCPILYYAYCLYRYYICLLYILLYSCLILYYTYYSCIAMLCLFALSDCNCVQAVCVCMFLFSTFSCCGVLCLFCLMMLML